MNNILTFNEFFPYINGENESLKDFFLNHYQNKMTIKSGGSVMITPPEMYGLLTKGRIKIYMANEAGNEKLMWFLEELNLIPGCLSDLFDKRMVADMDSEIYYVNKREFTNFILSSQDNLDLIMQQFYKRYVLCIQDRLNEKNENCRMKVFKFIYQIAVNYGRQNDQGQVVIDQMPSRKDIASIIGAHRSNVTRNITELAEMGIILKDKKNLIVKDMDRLQEIIIEAEAER